MYFAAIHLPSMFISKVIKNKSKTKKIICWTKCIESSKMWKEEFITNDFILNNISEGKTLGYKLKMIEEERVNNNFKLYYKCICICNWYLFLFLK